MTKKIVVSIKKGSWYCDIPIFALVRSNDDLSAVQTTFERIKLHKKYIIESLTSLHYMVNTKYLSFN